MKMKLERLQLDADLTIGSLTINDAWQCWTLEDTVRKDGIKIFGETAINAGKYLVDITRSPRFQRDLPLVLDVKNFVGIRIHPGNTAADTEGCILVGMDRLNKSIGRSRLAFNALMDKLQEAKRKGEPLMLEIVQ